VFGTPTQPETSVIGVELRGTGLGLIVIFTLAVPLVGAGEGVGEGVGVGEGDGEGDVVDVGAVGDVDSTEPHMALTSATAQRNTSDATVLVDFITMGSLLRTWCPPWAPDFRCTNQFIATKPTQKVNHELSGINRRTDAAKVP